jgi:4-amino-4-deoxy-L-arabinose transferase-like glycosyltransferase
VTGDGEARDGGRRWRLRLAAILVLAAAARIALILVTPHFTLFGDPADYERWATSLAGGHGFPSTTIASAGTPSAFRPPAYPLALAAVYWVVGVHPLAGRVLGAVLGVLAVGLQAELGRAVGGDRVGLWAGAIAAVFLPLVALSGTLVSEALFVPVELGLALLLVGLARRPAALRWSLLAGALCAVALLTRAVAVLWIVVAVVAVGCSVASGRPRRRALVGVVAAFAVVMVPWTVRNADVLHAFVPVTTEGGFTLAGQYNSTVAAPGPLQSVWQIPLIIPDVAARVRPLYARRGGVDEAQLDSALRTIAVDYATAHPGDVLRATANDTLRLFDLGPGHRRQTSIIDRELALPGALRGADGIFGQVLGVLALVGLALGLRRRRGFGPWWLWGMPATALLATVVIVGSTLKRTPLDPFLIVLAAVAIDGLALRAHRVRATDR